MKIIISLSLFLILTLPAYSQDISSDFPQPREIPLPGIGAGLIEVNPHDGNIWIYYHQSKKLSVLSKDTFSTVMEFELPMLPSAIAFDPDEALAYIVGEPFGDQRITGGLILVLNASDGTIVTQKNMDLAVNAIFVNDVQSIYVASGIQYGYQGKIYRLGLNRYEDGTSELVIFNENSCGKIPWAIAEYAGILYVTDLEMQWAEQPDGSMGPPYAGWVWLYDAQTLEFLHTEWTGINPDSLAVTDSGVLVGCAGRKQTNDPEWEPTLNLLTGDEESKKINFDVSGASDIDVNGDGNLAAVALSEWGEPEYGTMSFKARMVFGEGGPETRPWIFTGDLGIVDLSSSEAKLSRYLVVTNGYITQIRFSSDGKTIYALAGGKDILLVIPTDALTKSPLFNGSEW